VSGPPYRASGKPRARAEIRSAAARLPSAPQAELATGTEAHYRDPGYYSSTYAKRTEDRDYYLQLASERAAKGRCEVLEYGCGNGRILVPLAQTGRTVTGVDRSRPMLADLKRALRAERPAVRDRVTLRRGDMRNLKLDQRFDLVLCTFNTFLHLYGRRDVERFCSRVRAHLRPRGRFVVDVTIPDPTELVASPDRAYRVPRFRHPTTGQVVRYAERFTYDPLSQVLTVGMEFELRDEPQQRWTTPLAHRQFFPQELEALLHYNGLDVVAVHGDFETAPPDEDATSLIYHCRAR
jgi:SAM-dependent methyltransferase